MAADVHDACRKGGAEREGRHAFSCRFRVLLCAGRHGAWPGMPTPSERMRQPAGRMAVAVAWRRCRNDGGLAIRLRAFFSRACPHENSAPRSGMRARFKPGRNALHPPARRPFEGRHMAGGRTRHASVAVWRCFGIAASARRGKGGNISMKRLCISACPQDRAGRTKSRVGIPARRSLVLSALPTVGGWRQGGPQTACREAARLSRGGGAAA